MSLIGEIQNTARGAAVLKDWLGDAEVVPQHIAEERAKICIDCPENREPRWWEKIKTDLADRMILHLSVKNKIGLAVKDEEKLGICRVCGCCNPLAIWVPNEHLKKHTSAELQSKFPAWCWKKYL